MKRVREITSGQYAICSLSAVVYIILCYQFRTGIFNDDAVFVLGARQLWNALPFRSLVLKPDYPLPGLPLLLAPVAKWVEPHWLNLEWMAVAITLGSILLMAKWARQLPLNGETVAVTALFAFNPLIAQFSGILMPEAFYMTVIIASYMLMNNLLEEPNVHRGLALGFLLGWGSLIRPEGILLLMCILAVLVWTRQGRSIMPAILLPIGLWAVYFLHWWHTRHVTTTEYGSDLAALTSYWSHHLMEGVRFSGSLLYDFVVHALTTVPSDIWNAYPFFSIALTGIGLAIIALGFQSAWKARIYPRPLLWSVGCFCALYFMVHAVWHVLQPRYAVPMLPFVILFAVRGTTVLFSRLQWPSACQQGVFVLLLFSYLYKNGVALHETLWARDPMKSPPWNSLRWIREQTPPDAKVISNIAPNIELYTDRPALSGIQSDDYELLMYEILSRRFEYVVDRRLTFLAPNVDGTDNINDTWKGLRLWMMHHPSEFNLAFSDAKEQTDIYRINPEPGFTSAYPKYIDAARLYRVGKLEEAFRLVNDAFRLDPSLGCAANLLGTLYWIANDRTSAEHYFIKMKELLPLSWEARLNLATLYHHRGQEALSEQYIQEALDIAAHRGLKDDMIQRIQSLRQLWTGDTNHMFVNIPPQAMNP